MRRQRQLELGIIALGFSALGLLIITVGIGLAVAKDCGYRQTVITPRPAAAWDTRPDVSHCINNPDVEIWACIRDNPKPSPAANYRAQMKREDI